MLCYFDLDLRDATSHGSGDFPEPSHDNKVSNDPGIFLLKMQFRQ